MDSITIYYPYAAFTDSVFLSQLCLMPQIRRRNMPKTATSSSEVNKNLVVSSQISAGMLADVVHPPSGRRSTVAA